MAFDPNNIVVQLCAQGMQLEGKLEQDEAKKLFNEAWDKAQTNFEKFIACHFIARHQDSLLEKLRWDELALSFALSSSDKNINENYSSLYLNIAKGFEDLGDLDKALNNYQLADSYTGFLPEDGYGAMIRSGIQRGMERITSNAEKLNEIEYLTIKSRPPK